MGTAQEGATREELWTSLSKLLKRLYAEQIDATPDDSYIRVHATPAFIDHQVRTFLWYMPRVRNARRLLDWGCNHGPDSCLLRAHCGKEIDLYSCDFVEPDRYNVFRTFSETRYKKLEDNFSLPYPSSHFDAVIGSGVLEHTAMDDESLKEVYRVMRPDGILVISYLPNRWSVQEWIRRRIHKKDFHRRVYGMSEARRLLKRRGFYPVASGYHTFFWDRKVAALGLRNWQSPVSGLLRRVVPVEVFSSTLFFIATKVHSM